MEHLPDLKIPRETDEREISALQNLLSKVSTEVNAQTALSQNLKCRIISKNMKIKRVQKKQLKLEAKLYLSPEAKKERIEASVGFHRKQEVYVSKHMNMLYRKCYTIKNIIDQEDL